jgi:hypothetical protein
MAPRRRTMQLSNRDSARLLPQPDGFEGFVSLLEHPLASDLPVLDREHERAPRDHFDPLAPPQVGGVRDHDFGPHLREAVHLNFDVLKDRPELAPEDLTLAVTAIDTLEALGNATSRFPRLGDTRLTTPSGRAGSRPRSDAATPRCFPTSSAQYLAWISPIPSRSRVATRRSSRRSRPTLRGSP